jgi:hypothetical protein
MSGVVKFIKTIGFLAVTALLVTACGSGGGDTTPVVANDGGGSSTLLSGTAAAGAPIIGTVTIKDSASPANTKFVTIEADGNYSVDVSGLTAPYMVRADGYVGGNEYHLYSAGTAADVGGTINITPLTDLIVANIAGSIAATYFDNGAFSNLTADELTAESVALRDKLLPVLQAIGVSDSIDLLRASFNTDHTGIDAALDILKVETDSDTQIATITNVITQEKITSDLAAQTYSATFMDTTNVASGVTDIQAITTGFNTFSSLFAAGLPSPENLILLALFDAATFLDEGQNLASFLGEITTEDEIIGLTFTNITIKEMDVALGTALVGFDVMFNGVLDNEAPEGFYMIKKDGIWKMQGNQRIAQVSVQAVTEYHPNETISSKINSGLSFYISDRGGLGLTHAVVTGNGLPAEGVTLENNIAFEEFQIMAVEANGNTYSMTDADIGLMAETGETYTVELYDATGLQATYTEKIMQRPYLVAGLTAAMFPVITSPTMDQMMAFVAADGGDGTISWTLPTGLTNDWLSLGLNGNGDSAMAEFSPAPEARSQVFTLPAVGSNGAFTATGGWIWLAARDAYDRRIATSFGFDNGPNGPN